MVSLNLFTFLIVLGVVGGVISLTTIVVILITEKEVEFLEVEKKRAKLEVLLNESKFMHLSSQIRPHFLFNTLNVISTLIRLEKKQEAEQATYAIASLMRYHLKNDEPLVSVQEELEYVRHYLTIQKLRFGNRLHWSIDAPDQVRDKLVPLLAIQTLVENACIHGIEPSVSGGQIKLCVLYEADKLLIDVVDNGIGVSDKVIAEFEGWKVTQKSAENLLRIGIRNVHSRLVHQFGSESGLTIYRLDQGTASRLEISYREE